MDDAWNMLLQESPGFIAWVEKLHPEDVKQVEQSIEVLSAAPLISQSPYDIARLRDAALRLRMFALEGHFQLTTTFYEALYEWCCHLLVTQCL